MAALSPASTRLLSYFWDGNLLNRLSKLWVAIEFWLWALAIVEAIFWAVTDAEVEPAFNAFKSAVGKLCAWTLDAKEEPELKLKLELELELEPDPNDRFGFLVDPSK